MSTAARVKRATFAHHVFAGKSQQQAARMAGYKNGPGLKHTAKRLARHPEVVEELERLQAEHGTQAGIDRARLVAVAERIMDDEGASNYERLKAVEVLARLLGLYKPEDVNHRHSGTVHLGKKPVEEMTDSEIEAELQEFENNRKSRKGRRGRA